MKRLLDADKLRTTDPIKHRNADEAMIAFCQFVKDQKAALSDAQRARVLKTLRAMNLRPYWNYCREHMLDIGLEF